MRCSADETFLPPTRQSASTEGGNPMYLKHVVLGAALAIAGGAIRSGGSSPE